MAAYKTLKGIRDEVFIELGLDPDSGFNKDAAKRINNFINRTVLEMNRFAKWETLKASSMITLADGVSVYKLNASVRDYRFVGDTMYIALQRKIIRGTDEQFTSDLIAKRVGLPSIWRPAGVAIAGSVVQEQVEFSPVPALSQVGLVVNYSYYQELADATSDTAIPLEHADVIHSGVMWKYLAYDEDHVRSRLYEKTYLGLLKKRAGQQQGAKQFLPANHLRRHNSRRRGHHHHPLSCT